MEVMVCLNCFWLSWGSQGRPETLAVMAHKFEECGLLTRTPVLFLSVGFLLMCDVRVGMF